MNKCSVELPPDFLEDMKELTNNAIRLYIVLRYYRILSSKEYAGNHAWVFPEYKTIREESGITSNTGVRNGMIELLEFGWIADIKKGGGEIGKDKKLKTKPNRYCIVDEKLTPERINKRLIAKLNGDKEEVERIDAEIAKRKERNMVDPKEAKKILRETKKFIDSLENPYEEDIKI